jgi:hypothetical protein
MNPHYLVDGYNLIHYIPRFRNYLDSSLEHARNYLIHFLRSYLSSRQVRITIVFDGDEVGYIEQPPASNRWLKIIFSKSPEKADPIIKRIIQKTTNKKSLILVSADHELINYGSQSGVQVLSPEEFYDRISRHPNQEQVDQKFNTQVSEAEVDDWLKLFGEDSE